MSTVPKSDTPQPANNAQTKIVSDSMSGNYGRPASGGAPQAGRPEGSPAPDPPTADKVPGAEAYRPGPAADVSAAGTLAGPDMGHGATVVVPSSGDRPSGGKDSADLGTVGDSGNQQL